MDILTVQQREFLVYEAFIRRAAQLNLPFMLKGSYVTRQYFANPADRIPGDLDWLYMEPLAEVSSAREVFNDWVVQVTEQAAHDGVRFRSFRENAFWRTIDYAMDDDFPTVNTDLAYWLDGEEKLDEIPLDISFNLPLSVPSVPLLYRPLHGEPFLVPHTAPLALQISWKIHQTLVRPRFKDLFDLIHLLRHPDFTYTTRQQALQALVDECQTDETNVHRLRHLVAGKLAPLFPDGVSASWDAWRHGIQPRGRNIIFYFREQAEFLTNETNLPTHLSDFEAQVREAFQQAGFEQALPHLPVPTKFKPQPKLVAKAATLADSGSAQASGTKSSAVTKLPWSWRDAFNKLFR
ncbi:nucleotidyl transferase AbiEii/AbiGii toxin family protein [Hymenobacter cellulosilyticus]|uniref:Nucleotidyl transferase AbiEii/AbiGii toxin family protein n=1 Tax=Hymenobacter cellulosilyticus TaxID=2932248 RepID=A0A8T9Q6D5_9BACT|nr:nucleotidyl transferase AbiEii/AbiGii toxin family protein [Hymenobacter cellulosilyticus]UOQ71961.1 nucleotidyl transferase AbiEii/AbiGii toxin family protein [Hymenobacter cellulosilyticus]